MNPSWSHVAPAYHMRDPFANMGQYGNQAQPPTPNYGQRPYDHGPQPMPAYPYYPPQPQRAQPTYPQQPSYQQPSSGVDFQIGTFPIGNFGGGEDNRNGSQGGTTSPNSRAYETGIIEKLLHSYGFIQCCERQARLFFHFSQFEGNIEHLRIGDPVQFEVTFDKRNGKPIASTVSKITPESACGEERVTGVVTTELRNGEGQGRVSYENRGECFFLPYTKDDVEGNVTLHVGDTVSFQMTTSQRTGNLGALYIRLENLSQPVRYKGVVCAIRDGVGYIERADVVREISFKLTESELGPIQLGDEVEFNIETQNGEEYACSMTRLAAGTVVFEDVDPNVFKGQVVKPLDRSVPVNQQDPLPGRLRFRGRDRSEKAVQFGEKDQKGNYTLRHGDWVQFNIATDRRDKLQRATNIELLDESFAFSGERRESGVVSSLKGGGGHIKCAEREAPLSFSIDEWITPDQELTVGDEVEFTVLQDPTAATKLSAIRIKGLDPGTVQFDMVIQKDLNGTVTREPPVTLRNGSKVHDRSSEDTGLVSAHRNGVIEHLPFTVKDSDSLIIPKLGDEVIFDLAQIKRNKELVAVNVRVIPKPRVPTPPAEKPRVEVKAQKPKMAEKLFENGAMKQNGYKENEEKQVFQGWVAAVKDAYGFIETLEHDKEIFFHFSNYEGSLSNLDIGQEVEYTVTSKGQPQGKLSAENVRPLAKGSIARPPTASNVYYGTVVRQVRGNNPEQLQYSGIVKVGDLEGDGTEYEFGVTSFANKKDFLQRGDLVQFQLEGEEGSVLRAANIKVMRTKLRATVDHMKAEYHATGESDQSQQRFVVTTLTTFLSMRNIMPRLNPTNHVTEIRGYYAAYHAPERGQYGFLNYEVDEKKLFFHVSEVKDDVSLQAGDAVEFYLISNQKTGKNSASNVVKLDSQRPERLIQRVRAISFDETNAGPRIHVTRQPRGPDGTKGFRRVKQTLTTIHDDYE